MVRNFGGEAELGAKRRAYNAIPSGENCTRSYLRARRSPSSTTAIILTIHHITFRDSLRSLQYIVVDEIHYYGENKIQTSFEGVMNRLRMRSPNQTFIATSATVTDASKLIKGVPFKEISQDTSGSGKQNYYATKSPIMTPTPAQQSPVTTVAEICLESYQCGLKVMAFGRTRGLCEGEGGRGEKRSDEPTMLASKGSHSS